MSKKRTISRKDPIKVAPSGKSTLKRFRSTAPASDTLPIVDSQWGRALQLRDRLGMSRERFVRLVPMSTRNLANLESGKAPTAKLSRQLQALRRVVDALSEVIHRDAIGRWLEQPNDAFDGLKPIEVIERGEVDRIWQMIFYLRSGVAS
jgi:transcriptional regulator with XRE-family HTH domain